MGGDYAGIGRPADVERRRLGHLAERLNPATQRWIRERGIGLGWHCLEVGAAEGSMSRWLADQVGADGQVVAADLDLRFLADVRAANLEVRKFDLRHDPIEADHFDLAYCRTLLLHLPDPAAALRKLVSALRPGGVLLVQEPDAGSAAAADLDHPDAARFGRLLHAAYGWLRENGTFDPYFGRRLPGLFASLGLVETGHDAGASILRGASPEMAVYQQTLEALAPLLSAKGVLSDSDLADLRRMYREPGFDHVSEIQFVAWGRKPG